MKSSVSLLYCRGGKGTSSTRLKILYEQDTSRSLSTYPALSLESFASELPKVIKIHHNYPSLASRKARPCRFYMPTLTPYSSSESTPKGRLQMSRQHHPSSSQVVKDQNVHDWR